MRDARICLVTLGTADISRAVAFYEALGWTLAERLEAVAFLTGEKIALSLFGLDDLARDAGLEPGSGPGPAADAPRPALALAINMASEAEVDRLFETAVAAGARATKRPEKVFWGGYSGYFADPDGHLWEIAHNPFWPLTADGHVEIAPASET